MRRLIALLLTLSSLCAQVRAPMEAAESHFRAGQEAIQKGELEVGAAAFRRVLDLERDNGRAWLLLGYCLHGLGRLEAALPIHEKATSFPEVAHIGAYNVACVHSLQGRKDEAFAWLRKAMDLGFRDVGQLTRDSDLDPLRGDPRFAVLVDRIARSLQVYAPVTDRRSARVAFFDKAGSPAQINIDHGVLRWRPGFDQQMEDEHWIGRRWRLGSDFWTTLDTSVPLDIADVEVPAGYWYVTLTHRGSHRFVLGLHDPAAVRLLRIDPHQADRIREALEVPMHYRQVDDLQAELLLQLAVPPGKPEKGELRIAFGRHRLTANVRLTLPR